MNKENNGYIFGFATLLVVIVGTILAVLSIVLKPFQTENIENERKQNILKAIQIEVSRDEAGEKFKKYIQQEVVLNYKAEQIGNKAFDVDIQKEYKSISRAEDRQYPLFICQKDGQEYYVIPLIGTGLWGAIWGFVALQKDANTIYGASFDHKSETPGLGAEITEFSFYNQFVNKKMTNEKGVYTAIQVVKPGSVMLDQHKVDGITGGTLTSVGVEEMLNRTLRIYYQYFHKKGIYIQLMEEKKPEQGIGIAAEGEKQEDEVEFLTEEPATIQ